MIVESIQVLFKPGIFGGIVLLLGAISGWGMCATGEFVLTKVMRWWVLGVLVPVLKRPSLPLRAMAIFVNNASICVLLVASGSVPLLPWFTIAAAGLAIGAALRVMVVEFGWNIEGEKNDAELSASNSADPVVSIGMLLNLLELPAIGLTLALALMRHEVPITQPVELQTPIASWSVTFFWTLPLLALAAVGESMWMGRQRVFEK